MMYSGDDYYGDEVTSRMLPEERLVLPTPDDDDSIVVKWPLLRIVQDGDAYAVEAWQPEAGWVPGTDEDHETAFAELCDLVRTLTH